MYKQFDGWFDYPHIYDQIFNETLTERATPIFVEIGAYKGRSAAYMAEKMNNAKGGIIILVDNCTFENEENLMDAIAKIKEAYPKVEIILKKMSSDEAAKELAQDNLLADAVFVDGGHERHECYNDLVNYFPMVREGGIIAGHDLCHRDLPGVGTAVMQFCFEKRINFVGVPNDGTVDAENPFGCYLIKK